jgi:hypothetical protein
MYRAVVLTTLVLLMLAVAGVSVAQDGRLFAVEPNSDEPPESTTSGAQTSFEATGSEATTASPLPGASSETDDHQNVPEPTVVTEPTVGEPEKSTAAPAREETPTSGTTDIGNPGDSGRAVGKPEHAVEASDPVAAGSAEMRPHGNGEPEELGNKEDPARGVGRQKVVLCHKGEKTLTVGAPALAAHLRHGDTREACQGEVSGPEPAEERIGPEAARDEGGSGSGGRDKVVLCHKNKTLTVGAGAQEAHLRHGDSLGACP